MVRMLRSALALGLPLALAGCFTSEQPLIAESDSVAGIADGTYSYPEDSATKTLTISHTGGVVSMTSPDGDKGPEVTKLLMRELGGGYFVVMDPENEYALVRVDGRDVVQFDSANNCDELQAKAKSDGAAVSSYGVVSVDGANPSTCKFARYDDMARAYQALLDAKLLSQTRVYTRQ